MQINQLMRIIRQIVDRNGTRNRKGAIARIRRGDFRYFDFRGVDFSGVDFSGESFEWAQFHCAKFRGANFCNARFNGTDFRRANFERAEFDRAKFRGAKFRGVKFEGANFAGSRGIRWADCSWHGHGEWGERLLAIELPHGIRYFCGDFCGSEESLLKYINAGAPKLIPSCLRALKFCRESFF